MQTRKILIALTISSALLVIGALAGYKVRPWINPPASFTQLFHTEMAAFHARVAANFSGDEVIFLGDSHIQGMAVHRLSNNAVNFGVGSLQTQGVIDQLNRMPKLAGSPKLVVGIGFNDLRQVNESDVLARYDKLLAMLQPSTAVAVLSVMPIDERFIRPSAYSEPDSLNAKIERFNRGLSELVAQRPNTVFIDTNSVMTEDGRLPAQWHNGDGVHLSPAGYERLITFLNENW